jgi:hypothetical protein
MSSKTPTTLVKESCGSMRMMIAKFKGETEDHKLRNGDTWTTGIKTIVGDPWLAGAFQVGLSADAITGIITATAALPGPDSPPLGAASTMGVLGGSGTVTNTGNSIISGDLGISPGTSVTGFPPGIVTGVQHINDATAAQARQDFLAAQVTLSAMTTTTDLTGQDLGGKILLPGVYFFSSTAGLTGTLTLDAQGDPNAVFVFNIGSAITTATSSSVVLINNANPDKVFWNLGSAATLGTGTLFKGNILATSSITFVTGSTLTGRALAKVSVTMDTNSITVPPSLPPGIEHGTGTVYLLCKDM